MDEEYLGYLFDENLHRLVAMLNTPRWNILLTATLLSCLLAAAAPVSVRAQEAPAAENPSISADVVRSRLQAIEANQKLDESARQRLAELYRQILTDLDAGKALRDSGQQWLNRLGELPGQLTELNRELETWSSEVTPPDVSELTQQQLDKKVSELQADLSAAQSKLAALKSEAQRRSDRQLEAPKQVANLSASAG